MQCCLLDKHKLCLLLRSVKLTSQGLQSHIINQYFFKSQPAQLHLTCSKRSCTWVAKHGQLFRQLGCNCRAHLSVLLSKDRLACYSVVASLVATVVWQGTHVCLLVTVRHHQSRCVAHPGPLWLQHASSTYHAEVTMLATDEVL